MHMPGNNNKHAEPAAVQVAVQPVPAYTLVETVRDHEGRIRALETLAWKLVGGVVVGTAVGTTIGGAIVAWILNG